MVVTSPEELYSLHKELIHPFSQSVPMGLVETLVEVVVIVTIGKFVGLLGYAAN